MDLKLKFEILPGKKEALPVEIVGSEWLAIRSAISG